MRSRWCSPDQPAGWSRRPRSASCCRRRSASELTSPETDLKRPRGLVAPLVGALADDVVDLLLFRLVLEAHGRHRDPGHAVGDLLVGRVRDQDLIGLGGAAEA